MDAIVTAGGTPEPGDLLFPFTQGEPKAMVDVAGRPMIQWVLDALCQSELVERVVVIGLRPDINLICTKPLVFIPDQGEMLANIRTGIKRILELNPQAVYALVVSSDIPAITGEAVDWVVNVALQGDEDIYYNVISRQVMEARFPESRRSYIHLKDAEMCGGDMNVVRCSLAMEENMLWEELITSRKNILKQAALIGFDTLFLLLMRAISLEKAIEKVTRRLQLKGRAVVCPYAEVGMDVDKPHQLEIMRADLTAKLAGSL